MSKSGRPADVDDREAADALRDPDVTQLIHMCGEHIDLVFDFALQSICYNGDKLDILIQEHLLNYCHIWHRSAGLALQSRYADCGCSPFGRLVRRNAVVSGSRAEGLRTPGRPPENQTSSDLDVMVELGPVNWTLPDTEETSPVGDTAAGSATATTVDPRSQDSDPTLVIANTENPGFVLVLQERRDRLSAPGATAVQS